jgi:SAM-dependent methyltransferase
MCARTPLLKTDPFSQPMRDFYADYYATVEHSRAQAAFCEYAYGKNLCQHGFTTIEQLTMLIEVTALNATSRVIDLGCGNGMIAEHLSDATGAHVTGLDYIPVAIARAEERTLAKRNRLDFVVGDLTQPNFPPDSFDSLLSLDTLYFSDDYAETIKRWRALIRHGGQMAILYSHGANPQTPKENFDRATLPPGQTPLAAALKTCGLDFQTWDFTRQDYALAQRKKEILEKLMPEFETEGNMLLYENRLGEALGVLDAIESGMHTRYLYRVQL